MAERILIVDDEQEIADLGGASIWKVKILRCAPSTQPYRR